jgi:hypothetical protein
VRAVIYVQDDLGETIMESRSQNGVRIHCFKVMPDDPRLEAALLEAEALAERQQEVGWAGVERAQALAEQEVFPLMGGH